MPARRAPGFSPSVYAAIFRFVRYWLMTVRVIARSRTTATCIALIAMLAFAARAQDADAEADVAPKTDAVAPKTRAPLVINGDTIGELRMHQIGSIILPQGTPPFPAVVVLHGCNGVSQNTRVWARRLASWGYAALIIDSFTPRGLDQVCDGSRALPGPERANDVFAAAAYLRARPDIDGKRIGVFGYSHGGWTALNASTVKRVEQEGVPPFRAIVALYPFCPLKVSPPLATDVQIFIGDADYWAKASNCTTFVGNYGADAPHRPSLVVYPGVRHSFDSQRPERVYYGHELAYDPNAAADAVDRTRKFLDDHLRAE
jgi:dienelactone hydrolase